MRKRNCKYRGVKLYSCNGMKLVRYAFMACLVAMVTSCGNAKVEETPEVSSWAAYCAKYDVDAVNPSEEQEDRYMDCYVGSVEEEHDIDSIARTLHK